MNQNNQQNITTTYISPQLLNIPTSINQEPTPNMNFGPSVYLNDNPSLQLESNEDINKARKLIWNKYLNEMRNDMTRKKEVNNCFMSFGEVTMKYDIKIIGVPGNSGYPLFIALHGGGQSETPEMNDSQWNHMSIYYLNCITNGIYINPRGVRDTWDCHFNPESYPLYDRLIMNMIAFYNVDPNRVYLTGYSAGGDGVYAIVPRMADRFAAANMSAGHPNGIQLWNLYNMPLILQAGEKDDAYERNITTAHYNQMLDDYHDALGGGYEHKCFIHRQKPHNFFDNSTQIQKVMENCNSWIEYGESPTIEVDTNAIHLLENYIRNPIPKRVVWCLSQRAEKRNIQSFYWLRADTNLTNGRIVVSFDKETNSIIIEECSIIGEITFLINDDMFDVFSPINIKTSTNCICSEKVIPEYELLKETTFERGDYNYQFVAKITIPFG